MSADRGSRGNPGRLIDSLWNLDAERGAKHDVNSQENLVRGFRAQQLLPFQPEGSRASAEGSYPSLTTMSLMSFMLR